MQKYVQKYPDRVYLDFDPFSGDMDVDIKHHKCKLVKTRKEHTCVGWCMESVPHTIPKGSKVYYESAFLDGAPVSNYFCLKCYDELLEDVGLGPEDFLPEDNLYTIEN